MLFKRKGSAPPFSVPSVPSVVNAVSVPLGGACERRCIRVMIHAETRRLRSEIRHVYLRDAVLLRADLLAD